MGSALKLPECFAFRFKVLDGDVTPNIRVATRPPSDGSGMEKSCGALIYSGGAPLFPSPTLLPLSHSNPPMRKGAHNSDEQPSSGPLWIQGLICVHSLADVCPQTRGGEGIYDPPTDLEFCKPHNKQPQDSPPAKRPRNRLSRLKEAFTRSVPNPTFQTRTQISAQMCSTSDENKGPRREKVSPVLTRGNVTQAFLLKFFSRRYGIAAVISDWR